MARSLLIEMMIFGLILRGNVPERSNATPMPIG
jgi:hypothetical protein